MAAASTAAIIAAVASATAAAGSLAYTGYQMSQGTPSTPKAPTGVDPSQVLRGMLPGAKADAAARVGGGMSPQFEANLLGQQSGIPGGGLSILDEIKNSLGQGP